MGGLWAWVTGSGRSPAWMARVAKPWPSVRSRIRRLSSPIESVPSAGTHRAPSLGRRGRLPLVVEVPRMDGTGGWAGVDPAALAGLGDVWIPVGVPGYAGDAKARWQAILDGRFGADGWRMAHIVRGAVVSRAEAIVEYEAAYDQFLRARPALVAFLIDGLRQRLRRQRHQRPRRRVRPAAHRDEPLPGHLGPARHRGARGRSRRGRTSRRPTRPRRTWSTSGPARPTGCRGATASAATACCRSAIPSPRATA